MLPRRGLCRSAIVCPPVITGKFAAVADSDRATTLGRNRDTESRFPIGIRISGMIMQSPVVSGASRSERPCDLHTLYERIGQREFPPLRGVIERRGVVEVLLNPDFESRSP